MNENTYPTILSGYGFAEEPYLVFDRMSPGNNTHRDKFYIRDKIFSITRLNERFCIGRFDLSDFSSEPCPDKTPLSSQSNTCAACFEANGFNPAFYNVSRDRISPQQQKYNGQSHDVYLAYFGSNSLKVGIAHHARTLARWCEQGARVATIIKNCVNAYEARYMEFTIGKGLNLSEAFKGDKKRQWVNQPVSYNEAVKEIDDTRIRIERDLNIQTQTTEIINLDKYYLGSHVVDHDVIDVTNQDQLFISGTGVGMIGDILITEQAGSQFMVSMKKFLSYRIEVRDEIKTHHLPFRQMSLF